MLEHMLHSNVISINNGGSLSLINQENVCNSVTICSHIATVAGFHTGILNMRHDILVYSWLKTTLVIPVDVFLGQQHFGGV